MLRIAILTGIVLAIAAIYLPASAATYSVVPAAVRGLLAQYGVQLLSFRSHGGGEYTLRVRMANPQGGINNVK